MRTLQRKIARHHPPHMPPLAADIKPHCAATIMNMPPSPAPGPQSTPSAADMLAALHQWADEGVLRYVDAALAQFILAHTSAPLPTGAGPQPPHAQTACVLLAATIASHMHGQGHTCLPLRELVEHPAHILPGPLPRWQPLLRQLPQHIDGWTQALQAHPLIHTQRLSATASGAQRINSASASDRGQPLVLVLPGAASHGGPLLYLRRYWQHERNIARHIHARTASDHNTPSAPSSLRPWLDALFAPAPSAGGAGVPTPLDIDWQKLACALALHGRLTIITGGPGTGKTYTAARLIALLLATAPDPSALRIALAAPTGKAAARLKESITQSLHALPQLPAPHPGQPSVAASTAQPDHLPAPASATAVLDIPALIERIGPARTLHTLLGARPDSPRLRHNAAQPLDTDVLIVDEVSMIHLEMMSALLDALPAHARLILLGDKDQLASVEAGAVLGDLCRHAQAGHYSRATTAWAAAATGQHIPAAYHHRPAPEGRKANPTPTPPPALAQHTVMLRQSRRFHGPIGQLAHAVNQGHWAQALAILSPAPPSPPVSEAAAPSAAKAPKAPKPGPHAQAAPITGDLFAQPQPAPVSSGAASTPAPTPALPAIPPLHWHPRAQPTDITRLALQGRSGQPHAPSYAGYIHALGHWQTLRQHARRSPAHNAQARAELAALHQAWVIQVIDEFEKFRILCAVREGDWGVRGINAAIEAELQATHAIPRHGGAAWYAGRPVMLTRNDAQLGTSNGDIGITLPPLAALLAHMQAAAPAASGPAPAASLRVFLREGPQAEPRSISPARLTQVETAFAMTVHKSQGSEFRHTALILPPAPAALGRELLYTGITRARDFLSVLCPSPELLTHAIQTPTQRASGLHYWL